MRGRKIGLGFLALCLFAGFAACGDDDVTPTPADGTDASADTGRPDSTVGDGGGQPDASPDATPDATPDADTDADTDASDADTDGGVQPVVVSASADTHDRLFAVTHDAAGNIYAVGVKGNGGDAGDDFVPIVAKFDASGALVTGFGTQGFASVNLATGAASNFTFRGVVVQSDGKIVISGTVTRKTLGPADAAPDSRDREIALVRFKTDGQPDETFGPNSDGILIIDTGEGQLVGSSFLAQNTWGLALGANDTLVLAGVAVSDRNDGGFDTDWAVLRRNADGSPDTSFNGTGIVIVDIDNLNANVRNVSVLDDGSVVVAGYYPDSNGVVVPMVLKLEEDGDRDTNFGVNGIYTEEVLQLVTEAYSAVPLADAGFVTTGYGRNSTGESLDWVSLKLLNDGTRDTTYGNNDAGYTRIDLAGEADNSRHLAVLPDGRIVLVGGARSSATNTDGMVAVLQSNGTLDTTSGNGGLHVFNLRGDADHFWGISVAPNGQSVVIVGVAGGATATDDDDGAILVLPVSEL